MLIGKKMKEIMVIYTTILINIKILMDLLDKELGGGD